MKKTLLSVIKPTVIFALLSMGIVNVCADWSSATPNTAFQMPNTTSIPSFHALTITNEHTADLDHLANQTIKVPIPSSGLLFGSAITGLIYLFRRKRFFKLLYPQQTVKVMDLYFPVLNQQAVLELFQQWIVSKKSNQVFVANVHNVVSCQTDPELLVVSQNSLNIMDGLPLVWYAKLIHKSSAANRICGPDLMLKCLELGCEKKWKHFFLGGTEPILHDLVARMQNRYPGVSIVGWYSPSFGHLSDTDNQYIVDLINAAQPDFLWVGLGAPKQEKWIASHLHQIHVPVQLGVGAAFNFHSGHLKRAPQWIQKIGFEWLYRMLKEKRLVKRYMQTNPIFLKRLIKDFFIIRLLRIK
jgi:N-acetylglucosaminyldiphosphoundecaprenol N-acetyl-beta-D-mannosaminyltransferase